jgi:hypothetical protein
MTAVIIDDQTILALVDACTAMATLKAVGHWDPDTREPSLSWRRTADLLRAQLPEPGQDRTAGGWVEHGPGFVVLRLDRIDPATFPPDSEPYAQVSPATARGIGRAAFAQADSAERLTRQART